MAKLVCNFGGTGAIAADLAKDDKDVAFHDDTVRIYFSGCQDSRIGGLLLGGSAAPNLDYVADKIRHCFVAKNKLSLVKLREAFSSTLLGSAVAIEGTDKEIIEVDELFLSGFSRGAVTTFATARALDSLDIPTHIHAIEPVPGNSALYANISTSEFHKNFDLRDCTSIKSAEVFLGAYSEQVSFSHDTFYQQMVPLFNASCAHSIFLMPRPVHIPSGSAAKYYYDFLQTHGLAIGYTLGDKRERDRQFFIPKIVRQAFHKGVGERYELHPNYKKMMLEQIINWDNPLKARGTDPLAIWETLTSATPIKKVQALWALTFNEAKDVEPLWVKIKTDDSNEGKALREFIVEFQNIMVFSKLGIKDKKIFDTISAPLAIFSSEVLECIQKYSNPDGCESKKEGLKKQILNKLAALDVLMKASATKEDAAIFNRVYKRLATLMPKFLEDNIIFHPECAEFIDETETGITVPRMTEDSDDEFVPLTELTDIHTLCKRLYLLHGEARENAAVDAIALIPKLVTNAKNLAEIVRFLPARHLNLAMRCAPDVITSYSDVNQMLALLFTKEQKQALFDVIEDKIPLMKPTLSELTALLNYLPKEDLSSLLTKISLPEATNSAQIMAFFMRLQEDDIEQVAVALSKQLTDLISADKDTAESHELIAYLSPHLKNKAALELITSLKAAVVPTDTSTVMLSKNFKEQLSSLSSSLEPESQGNSPASS